MHVVGDAAGGRVEGVHDVLHSPDHADEDRDEAVVGEEQGGEHGVAYA